MEKERRLRLTIGPEEAGKSVLTLLRRALHLSNSAVRRAKVLPQGITLDGERVFTNVIVREGQMLSVQIGDKEGCEAIPAIRGPLSIVYEDEDLLVLDKPAPLAVHPSPGLEEDTLASFLLHYYQEIGLTAAFHPVNRLDRGTSGLMAVAKHAHAHERLQSALHSNGFQREYLAVCEGHPTPGAGVMDAPIGRVDDSFLKREVRPDGASSRTCYKTLFQGAGHSLLSLILETGRTHQIRVHLAHLGHPVVGDFLYGREAPALPGRFALHSHRMAFSHPVTGVPITLTSPLPAALGALLDGSHTTA